MCRSISHPFRVPIVNDSPTRGGALTRLPLATFFHPFGDDLSILNTRSTMQPLVMNFDEALSYLLSLGHETLTIKLGLRAETYAGFMSLGVVDLKAVTLVPVLPR